MARRAFDITSSSGTVRLDQQRTGKVVFTVTNGTGKSITARANIAAKPGTDPAWLAIQGDDERDVMPNGTLQYTVEVSVPEAGGDQFGFYLEVVNIDNPDEDFVTGPLVSFAAAEQPKPEPPAPAPPPPRRKMPWWIYVAVGIWTIIIAACLSQDELLVWICAVPLIARPLLLVARLAAGRLSR